MCESRGGRPGLSVPNRPYGLCGRKATLTLNEPLPAACVGLSVSRLPSWVTPGMVSVCFNYWQDCLHNLGLASAFVCTVGAHSKWQ